MSVAQHGALCSQHLPSLGCLLVRAAFIYIPGFDRSSDSMARRHAGPRMAITFDDGPERGLY